ncbi:MAG: thioredoxin family protein [Flavobacteriales bacterium]
MTLTSKKEGVVQKEHIDKAISYGDFKQIVKDNYDKGEPTSVIADKDMLLDFTKLNIKRMDRLDDQVELNPELMKELDQLSENWYWLVLAEGWCGDVAQNLPIIHKIADNCDKVDLKVLFRDQNTEVIDNYLTNGGRSIPKLIVLRSDNLEDWGPRPEPIQEMVMEVKKLKEGDTPKKELIDEYHKKMHKWYAKDKGQTIQKELLELVREWKNV